MRGSVGIVELELAFGFGFEWDVRRRAVVDEEENEVSLDDGFTRTE
jgi:hypothetical protein